MAGYLSENIPDLEVVSIINLDGNVEYKKVSVEYEEQYDEKWLNYFSMMISMRFSISGFNKQLDGLKMTVNVFKDKAVIVKLLESGFILSIIIPWKTNSVINAMGIMYNEKI